MSVLYAKCTIFGSDWIMRRAEDPGSSHTRSITTPESDPAPTPTAVMDSEPNPDQETQLILTMEIEPEPAPPLRLGSTGDHGPHGSTLISRHPAYAKDLRAFSYASSLQPSFPVGSTLLPPLWSPVKPASSPSSGTLAPPRMLIAVAPPWSPDPSMLLSPIYSQPAPCAPLLMVHHCPPWLLPLWIPPWPVLLCRSEFSSAVRPHSTPSWTLVPSSPSWLLPRSLS